MCFTVLTDYDRKLFTESRIETRIPAEYVVALTTQLSASTRPFSIHCSDLNPVC